MAKMVESVIVIKASKLVGDTAEASPVLSQDSVEALTEVVRELAGDGAFIEVFNEDADQ